MTFRCKERQKLKTHPLQRFKTHNAFDGFPGWKVKSTNDSMSVSLTCVLGGNFEHLELRHKNDEYQKQTYRADGQVRTRNLYLASRRVQAQT